MLQSELNVEDIVKERTNKTFHERCRLYFHADKYALWEDDECNKSWLPISDGGIAIE